MTDAAQANQERKDAMFEVTEEWLAEWEARAKASSVSVFRGPVLDLLAEVRRQRSVLGDRDRTCFEHWNKAQFLQQRLEQVDRTVFDPDLSDRSVRLLLAHSIGKHGRSPDDGTMRTMREHRD